MATTNLITKSYSDSTSATIILNAATLDNHFCELVSLEVKELATGLRTQCSLGTEFL